LDAEIVEKRSESLPEKHNDAVSETAAVRLWLRLLTCSITIEKRVRRRLAEDFETTLPRFDVLAALDRRPVGMTMGELSKALLVSGGNLTSLVRQLEQHGHVKMMRDPSDRRSWVVTITSRGRKSFKAMAVQHQHWIAEMFAGMSSTHRLQLYELLSELKQSLAAESSRTR
jgi:DNA-binding MarR family transcriptional regulator